METKDNSPKITKSKNSITIDGISVPKNAEANIANEDGRWVISFAPKKEKPIFKEGDFIVYEDNYSKSICIVKNIDGNRTYSHIAISISSHGYTLCSNTTYCNMAWELATEEDKHFLLVKMLEKGMFWDAENKKVQKIKNGDVLYIKTIYNTEYYSVFKEIKREYNFGLGNNKIIVDHFGMNASDGLVYINDGWLCDVDEIDCINFLSKSTTKFLFSELASQKKLKWNGEENKLEKIRFRAYKGEDYWHIDGEGRVVRCIDLGGELSDLRFELGNYFETEDEAKSVAPKVKELYNKIWTIS